MCLSRDLRFCSAALFAYVRLDDLLRHLRDHVVIGYTCRYAILRPGSVFALLSGSVGHGAYSCGEGLGSLSNG